MIKARAPKWYNSPQMVGTVDEPWIARGAIRFLERIMKKEWRGFEFGTGTSTPWYASRLKSLVAVEHNPKWANLVREYLKHNKYDHKVQLMYVPADLSVDKTLPKAHEAAYHNYAHSIDQFPDGYFEFCAIDGRARQVCFECALPKVTEVFVLDNSRRARYSCVFDWMAARNWACFRCFNGWQETTIWLKNPSIVTIAK